jgi:hypothetical protein
LLIDIPIPPVVSRALNGYFIGQKVRRGVDWKWDVQDGGSDCFGYVVATEKSHPRSQPTGWVSVEWQNSVINSYRAGDKSLYCDLEIIDNGTFGEACVAADQAEASVLLEESKHEAARAESSTGPGLANAVTVVIATRALTERMGAAAAGIAFMKNRGHRLEAPVKVRMYIYMNIIKHFLLIYEIFITSLSFGSVWATFHRCFCVSRCNSVCKGRWISWSRYDKESGGYIL